MLRRCLPFVLLLGCSSTTGAVTDSGEVAESPPAAEASKPAPPSAERPVPAPREVSAEELAQVSTSINAFSHELYAQVAAQPGNLVMSPASVAIALGMTYQGATGTTAKEFGAALHVGDIAPSQWHAAAGALGERWNASANGGTSEAPAPEVALANRLFGAQALPFKDAFLSDSARDYRAPMERLDFGASERARAHINGWVQGRTHDRIQDLIPSGIITADTLLVLANAVYFKAKWSSPFTAERTADADFTLSGGKRVPVPMMQQTASFKHTVTEQATVVQMPYAGGPFAMTLAMPNAADGLGALEKSLADASITQWSETLTHQRIALSVPKFKVAPTASVELSGPLQAMGLKRAFTDAAEFGGMVDPKDELLKIDKVFHKGFIEVDEAGTEAAAATAVIMARAGGVPAKPISVAFDRPFLFFITDTDTGAIVFMGRVVDPR